MTDVTQRFSSRVENYIKYRPGYPNEVIETLRSECELTADSIVADVGSGTGILTEILLRNGNEVYGVEPNRDMREAAERLLKDYPRFHSVSGRAEETTLDDASVDFVTAGQAFHWFDREKTREEFTRILRPRGWIALLWNERFTNTTPFLVAYEQLLKDYSTDYEQVDHRRIDDDVIRDFFGSDRFRLKQFKNAQVFDYDGVKGRLLSSSYAPEEGNPNYEPALAELERIFQAYQDDGKVVFEYVTQMYYGRLI
ncbi:MAG TPA: class I SAM-dependent methyltransferase [Blastocatellia bacterium]|jgi:ubiquinone/menaquinone biosynthesis C-methylase UbiE|nr:class I SAM-dependent methyltransferase [Blastocatellia bacterium]